MHHRKHWPVESTSNLQTRIIQRTSALNVSFLPFAQDPRHAQEKGTNRTDDINSKHRWFDGRVRICRKRESYSMAVKPAVSN